nr:hypothetical protein [Tanacetum cinerariifolium]
PGSCAAACLLPEQWPGRHRAERSGPCRCSGNRPRSAARWCAAASAVCVRRWATAPCRYAAGA